MSDNSPPSTRSFSCGHCHTAIQIPVDFPPTTGPCPHCGQTVTSPPVEAPAVVPAAAPAPVAAAPVAAAPPAKPTPPVQSPPQEKNKEKPQEVPTKEEPAQVAQKKSSFPTKLLLVGVAGLVLLIGLAIVVKMALPSRQSAPEEKKAAVHGGTTAEERSSQNFQQKGWIPKAQTVLSQFLSAQTPAERAALTLDGVAELETFYQQHSFDEGTTSLKGFSPVSLAAEDTSRGIFLMNYSRPSQFSIRDFFRPIPSLRVSYGLEKPDSILTGEAALKNFVAEPVRVMAFFRQQEDGRMLLDWETFVQTKYRLLREFVENPSPGREGVFRVFIQEDVDLDGRDDASTSVFRLSDPAHQSDHAKVLVRNESELGRAFDSLKWRGRVVKKAPVRNATVKLTWSNESEPTLQLGGLLCWQFLDLGGELGDWKKELEQGEMNE